jgi:hypothetical protein
MELPNSTDVESMSPFSQPYMGSQCVPLSGVKLLEFTAARRACSKVTGAVRLAAISGWTIAIFAGIVLFTGISTTDATWMGLLMTMAAMVEFRARDRLRRLETSAARTLGWNQLALGLVIVLYAAWNIDGQIQLSPGPIQFDSLLQKTSMQFSAGHLPLGRDFNLLLYSALGVIALLTQGTAAWYCFSRERWIRQYVGGAPGWIVELQRSGVRF